MSRTPSSRLLEGTPRRVLVLVLALTGVLVVAAVGPWSPAAVLPRVVRLASAVVLVAALGRLLLWRAVRVPAERLVWRRFALSAGILAVGVLVSAACTLLPSAGAVGSLPFAVAVVLTFPPVYGGLVRWNRYATSLADPNDVLNGISAVLTALALANLVLHAVGGPLAAAPAWRVQPLLAATGAAVVYLGTGASMAFIAALRRDLRVWLVTAALGLVLVAALVSVWSTGAAPGLVEALAAVAAALLALAAVLPNHPAVPQPADAVASTIGAFSVILLATATWVADQLLDAGPLPTACAALATLGSSFRLLVNVRDLSQLSVSRREALTDDLTGLANRRAVVRRLTELCASATPFVLALLDLDKFKEVNDGLGHAAGDDLLEAVARRLEAAVGPGSLVGRLGGDEFAVVVPTPAGDPHAIGVQLSEQLSGPLVLAGLTVHVAVSVGTAVHRADGHDPADCATRSMRQADTAMYDAKRTGAGVVAYDPARHTDTSGRLALVEELRTGVAAGQLVLHHQPQVDVDSGRTIGVEALVRWQHPTRGLLGPADFLPLAEVHGLMGAVTDEVLAQAVAQASRWRRGGTDLRVSVNLSASNLLDVTLAERVAELLARHDVPASALVLEVTETVLLSDAETGTAVLRALAALGTTVSIDDFGTGYSSLSYLRNLPAGELKLDRSFTVDLLADARAAEIVGSTIELAHRLGLRVVAEGVEDRDTLHRLRELGCDESQGYLHARPLPPSELTAWLDGQLPAPQLTAAGR